ncbi:MAG: hypothetical protein IJ637_06940 [Prevotella sp.]|nr:hypothetical protein [Prevotella sp.]
MLSLIALLTWGCSSSDDDAPAAYTFATAEAPAWSVDLTGSDAAPQWTAPDPSRFESSMFAMVTLQDELRAYSSDDDLMTVFIGDECRAIPSVRTVDKTGDVRFVLKIRGNSTDRDVTFRLSYYCAMLRQVFTLQGTETFATELTYGFDEEFVPPLLRGCKKYPVQNQLTVSLPARLPFTPHDGDLVAVFAGSECRGVGAAGKPFTVFRTTADEVLQVRYYSVATGGVYSLMQAVALNADEAQTLALVFDN